MTRKIVKRSTFLLPYQQSFTVMFLILRLSLLAFLMVLCNAEAPKQDVVPEVPDQDNLSSSPIKNDLSDKVSSDINPDESQFTDESLDPKERAKRSWNYLQNLAIDALIKRERDVKEAIKCVIGLECNLPTVFRSMLQEQGAQVLLYGRCMPIGSCSATTESMALIFSRRVRQMYPDLYKSTIDFLTDLENSEDEDYSEYVDSADDYYYEDEARSFKSEQISSDKEETLFTVKDADVERGRSYQDGNVSVSRTHNNLSDDFSSATEKPGAYKMNYGPEQTYRRVDNNYGPVNYRQRLHNQRGLRGDNRRNFNSTKLI